MIAMNLIDLIASAVLATCLAQAEPAPPEPTAPPASPSSPRITDPGPAEAAPMPSQDPTAPGTPAPPPGSPGAPAPTGPGSPTMTPAAAPANTVGVLGGLAARLGPAASRLGPKVGFSVGGSFQHRYALLPSEIELGVAADFFFDRFSTAAIGSSTDPSGAQTMNISSRTITETSFAALQTFGVRTGPTFVWFGAGGGLAVGFLSSPEVELQPGNASAYQPFARAVAGADVAINDQVALGFRAGYTFMLTSPAFTTSAGNSIQLFGDLLDIHGGLFYRFR
jgi:hypothetical protein